MACKLCFDGDSAFVSTKPRLIRTCDIYANLKYHVLKEQDDKIRFFLWKLNETDQVTARYEACGRCMILTLIIN